MDRTIAFKAFIARLNVVEQWSSLAHLWLARQQKTCSIHNRRIDCRMPLLTDC